MREMGGGGGGRGIGSHILSREREMQDMEEKRPIWGKTQLGQK